jgi:hypothetical protein
MKQPKYPETPMRNCAYCRYFNQSANACSAPNSDKIAVFNRDNERDCILLKYEKSENPKVNSKEFVEKFCLGTKCPYYYKKFNLCTRPSLCPFPKEVEPEKDMLDNIIL